MPKLNVQTVNGWEDATMYSFVNAWDNVIPDCLLINTNNMNVDSNQRWNKLGIVSTELTPSLANNPLGDQTFLGYRIVLPAKHRDRNDFMCSVVIFEQYPDAGRIWRNTWNGDPQTWTGWAAIAPPYDIYPIGSLYMSIYNTSPASLFGGTWTPIYDRFIIAAGGSYESTSVGGEATHTLTTAEIPAHTHNVGVDYDGEGSGTTNGAATVHKAGTSGAQHQVRTSSIGSSAAHNNIPPYYAAYIWVRVS